MGRAQSGRHQYCMYALFDITHGLNVPTMWTSLFSNALHFSRILAAIHAPLVSFRYSRLGDRGPDILPFLRYLCLTWTLEECCFLLTAKIAHPVVFQVFQAIRPPGT